MKGMKLLQVLAAGMLLLSVGCNNSHTGTPATNDTATRDTTSKGTTDSTLSKDSVSSNPDAPSEPH